VTNGAVQDFHAPRLILRGQKMNSSQLVLVEGSRTFAFWLPWAALAISVLANIISNLVLKSFTLTIPAQLEWRGALSLLANPLLWLGLVMTGIIFVTYVFAIRTLPLSIAYPIATGLAAVGITLVGCKVFGEPISLETIAGIALVIAGIGILGRTVQ
jgi:multidrug transporter EmrE-like cation transporter